MTTMQASAGRNAARAQAALVAASFAMFLAGSNAVNPLLPAYRKLLGLDPLTLSLTFVLYVTVLVVVLFVLARPRFARHAVPFLLISLAIVLPSDLLLAHAQEWSILLGRALAGIAGGLGTGAASALVVAAIGDRGRAVTATGNFAGAVLGAAGSQLVFTLLAAAAPRAVFLGHGIIVAVLLAAVAAVLRHRRDANRAALATTPEVIVSARINRSAVRMLAVGTIAWIATSAAVVFGATAFADLDRPLVQAIGPTLLLGSSAAAQLASPVLARIAPWASGTVAMALGAASIVTGARLTSDAIAITGFAILGAGIGVSFRAALIVLTRGATPARQGALASLYAAVTYSISATAVLLIGWIANTTGVVAALLWTLGIIAALAVTALLFAPRLHDTTTDPTQPAPQVSDKAGHDGAAQTAVR